MHYKRLRSKLSRVGRAVRGAICRPRIVVEIDLEPDEYIPTAWGRAAWTGAQRAFQAADSVRDAFAAAGRRVRFSWGLRLDPQIAIGEGSADFVLSEFADEIDAARHNGDSFGIHPHWYRFEDGRWVEDTSDSAWIQHCIGLSLDTFRARFGTTPTWIHFGESWMDQACFNRAIDEGVRLVLTPEPGMKIEPENWPGRSFRGTYPDYPEYLRRPYWGSRRDFRCRGLQRKTIVVPRTAAPLVKVSPGGSTHTNCWVSENTTKFKAWIQQACVDGRGSYFLLAGRSHVFHDPTNAANLLANLTWLAMDVDGPEGELTTPEEAFLDA